MKFILLLTVACFQVSAASLAQSISLSKKNASLETIFEEVTRQTGYEFLYNSKILEQSGLIDIEVENASLQEVLSICFKDQPLTYIISEKSIVIKLNSQLISQPILFKNEITGQVKNKAGESIPGVNVAVKGTSKGTVTDNEGRFSVDARDNDTIVFSFIGFKRLEVLVGSQSVINTVLEEDVLALGEVVISGGYYETTDRTKTGNITRVTAKEIENQPVASPLMALQGRVAGLEISPQAGTPGGAPKIRIRGINSLRSGTVYNDGNYPLYVIDGVAVNSGPVRSVSDGFLSYGFDPIGTIGPENIESIDILKDGDATAIYGSRAANGVILITTKKGRLNSSTSFEVNIYRGIGQISKHLKLLNNEQYLEVRHEAFENDQVALTRQNAPDILVWDTTRHTDWQKILLGGTANITDLQATLSGGNSKTSFRLSGGYQKQTMILPGDFWYSRGNLNLNVNHTSANEKFYATISVNYGNTSNRLFDDSNFINQAIFLPPNAPVLYDSHGALNWEIDPSTGNATWINPMRATLRTNTASTSNLIMSGLLSYELFAGFLIKANVGINETYGNETAISPISSYSPNELGADPIATTKFGTNERKSWLLEPQLSYTWTKAKHSLSVVAGTTLQQNTGKFQNISARYNTDDFIESLQAAASITYLADDNSMYRYTSVFARVGYNYDEKYFINLTGRRDGSSRFGPNNKFGNFGSLGVAWIFSNESFINEHMPILSLGKIRASYGITGSDQIGDYGYYDLYKVGTSYNNAAGLFPDALFNPDYAWEKTAKLEAAMQLGFLKDRISLEASIYQNKSSNQLVQYPLPATAGFQYVLKNYTAIVENKGLELSFSLTVLKETAIKWTSSLNFSFPKNRLVEFKGIENSPYATQYKVGESLSVQRLFTYTGVDPATGKYTFLDVNSDGFYNELDKKFMNPLDQKFYGGFNNAINYKGVELSFLFQFSYKDGTPFFTSMPGVRANQPISVLNRWQKEGDVTNIPKFSQDSGPVSYQPFYLFQSSNAMITNASFIRLKTLSIAFVLPKKSVLKLRLKGIKLFAQAQNLWTLTPLKNLDPETGSALPPLRMLTVGVNIKL